MVINRDSRFWQELGFKEINIQSTKNKKINKLIKKTRNRKGKVYYSCMTKDKLAFLIPTKKRARKSLNGFVSCYTILVL